MSKQFYFEKLIEKEKDSLSLSHVDKENLEKEKKLFEIFNEIENKNYNEVQKKLLGIIKEETKITKMLEGKTNLEFSREIEKNINFNFRVFLLPDNIKKYLKMGKFKALETDKVGLLGLSILVGNKENLEKSFDLFSSNISSEDFFLEDYELLSKILIQRVFEENNLNLYTKMEAFFMSADFSKKMFPSQTSKIIKKMPEVFSSEENDCFCQISKNNPMHTFLSLRKSKLPTFFELAVKGKNKKAVLAFLSDNPIYNLENSMSKAIKNQELEKIRWLNNIASNDIKYRNNLIVSGFNIFIEENKANHEQILECFYKINTDPEILKNMVNNKEKIDLIDIDEKLEGHINSFIDKSYMDSVYLKTKSKSKTQSL